jgi:glycosyltransferase involved in cell wall biosynthesis
MKFSIITPSYNQGAYIQDTLDSVLATPKNCSVEHIVVDGGSTDRTISILQSYGEQYSNLSWKSEPDLGQSDAINKGLKLATGEIIAYLNSDDYYLTETFNIVEKIFVSYPEVDFVYGDIFMVNQSKEVLRRIKSLRTSLWHHLYSFSFPQQSCFWRRKILDLVPEFNIKNKTCMDREFFAQVLSHPITMYRISEPLACFRLHDQSISGSGKFSKSYERDRLLIEQEFFSSSTLTKQVFRLSGRLAKYYHLVTRPKWEIFTI